MNAFWVRTVALAAGMIVISSAHGQWARLVMHSEQGDYIGAGQDWNIYYTPANSQMFYFGIRGSLPSGEPAELEFSLGNVGSDGTWALMMFGTDKLGIKMQPGYYPNARRADFAPPGHPGLDVSFQHRGSNEVTGEFTVHEATFGFDGSACSIRTFRLTFEQHSEGLPPALFGDFEFHAVPEPSAVMGMAAGSLLLGLCRRRLR